MRASDSTRRSFLSMALFAGAALALAAFAWHDTTPQSQAPPEMRGSDIIERTGVSLLLLDVEVSDSEGRPIHGLTRDDFAVQLNAREYDIYSVDDLCKATVPRDLARGSAAEATDATGSSTSAPSSAPADAEPRPPAEPSPAATSRYILYFDFAHLRASGRARSYTESQRWVQETMRPGDEVMVVAYAEVPGLREIVPFTSDRERLIQGIRDVHEDPVFLDGFAMGFGMRVEMCCLPCPQPWTQLYGTCCEMCCPRKDCSFEAREQYRYGKHSLTALRNLLRTMEDWPGRKALILYHQQHSVEPARLYGQRTIDQITDSVGDHHALVDEVAAEANLTGTTVSSAFVGDYLDEMAFVPRIAVLFGRNLASFTGGRFNRGEFDLAQTTDGVGRATCIYRLGLRLPDRLGGKVLRAKVWVRDRPAVAGYRVRLLTATDRWWRQAQNLLRNPELAHDVPLGADLFPLRRTEKGWDVEVRVALEPQRLTYLPGSRVAEGELELGALLSRGEGWSREMLARSTLRARDGNASGTLVLAHEYAAISPGDYRLGAFVRDRVANAFGASSAAMHLPRRGADDLAGPLAVIAAQPHLRSPLPLFKEKKAEARRAVPAEGPLPVTVDAIPRGTLVEFVSWICPESAESRPDDLLRFVVGETGPLFRFDGTELAAAGDCFRLSDPVRTEALEPGRYDYNLRWRPGSGADGIEGRLEFRVVD